MLNCITHQATIARPAKVSPSDPMQLKGEEEEEEEQEEEKEGVPWDQRR